MNAIIKIKWNSEDRLNSTFDTAEDGISDMEYGSEDATCKREKIELMQCEG